jgi:hypothetical protein
MKPSSIAVLLGLAGVMGVGGIYAAKYLNPGSQKILDPGSKTTKDPGSSTTKTPDGSTITKAQRLRDLQKKKEQIEAQLKTAQETVTRVEGEAKKLCTDLRFEFEPFCIICGKGSVNDQIERECLEFVQGKRTLSAQKYSDLGKSKHKSTFEKMKTDLADAQAKITSNTNSLKPIVAEIQKLESEGVL